jgi:hypothetical protein
MAEGSDYAVVLIHLSFLFCKALNRSMKKINFQLHILPHLVAVAAFLIVTIFFFKPIFFDNKSLTQHDIDMFLGSSKAIVDYRNQTGEEALWAPAMFSGMPAYLISVQWGNKTIGYIKRISSFSLPNAVANIYLSFLCYYILLISFGVRPYLAIGGALAFGLSTYMIVGVSAGHNGRIAAIAFMPLVMAGIHLAFTNRRILGLGVTTVGLALQLRENHLQITYYLVLIVIGYGIIRLIEAVRNKTLPDFAKTVGVLTIAAVVAAGTCFGPLWAVKEYEHYSIRGASELAKPGTEGADGLSKERAFAYRYGILEPMTLLIPQFYGGSSATFFGADQKSASYQALANSGNNQLANQLISYTSAYWGPQDFATPYYAGAIIVFLFAIGVAFADPKYVWWLVPLSILSLMLSWGDSFRAFNYFMFDYVPGYNNFRSMNFALIIILFAMPLLGFAGLEKLLATGVDKAAKKKLLIVFSAVGGLCLLLLLFAGMFAFTKSGEEQLPPWFMNALAEDRKGLLRSDAFRSLAFISSIFILIYFNVHKKISPAGFYIFLILAIIIDLTVVNKRYLTDSNFKRKRDNTFFTATESDAQILADKSYYRVYNMNLRNPYDAFSEARTSYFHHSVGGYHGAKMRRYQDFYDSCLIKQHFDFLRNAQQGKLEFSTYSAFNMLNVKYLVLGPESGNVIQNTGANGSAWFVKDIIKTNTPAEELEKTCGANTRTTAIIDVSQFPVTLTDSDSSATIDISDHKPNYLKYQSHSSRPALAVFSEIYYPGWKATIDGKDAPVMRADYILRALEVPAGDHTIEFSFEPKPYVVGNKVTMASSWLALLILLGCIGWTLKRES